MDDAEVEPQKGLRQLLMMSEPSQKGSKATIDDARAEPKKGSSNH